MIEVKILRERQYIPGKLGEVVLLDDAIAHQLAAISYVEIVKVSQKTGKPNVMLKENKPKTKAENNDE